MLLLRFKPILLFISLTLSFHVVAEEDPDEVKLACRIPVLNSQISDVMVPRIGIEYFAPNTKFRNMLEVGRPLYSTFEKKYVRGYYFGGQFLWGMGLPYSNSEAYMGFKFSYMEFNFRDYLRYEYNKDYFAYSRYQMSDIEKSRLFGGLCFLKRYSISGNFFFEWQAEIGYAEFKIKHDKSVKQRYYHNGIYSTSDNYSGMFLGAGLNLYYRIE